MCIPCRIIRLQYTFLLERMKTYAVHLRFDFLNFKYQTKIMQLKNFKNSNNCSSMELFLLSRITNFFTVIKTD